MEPLEILKINGDIPQEVRSITIDSRKVVEGALFIAIKGEKTDGHKYVRDAKEHGAVLFVVQEETGVEPEIVVPDTRIALSRIAHEFYERPSEVMKVIGITGTNGKTTT
ncbi:MAG TPA: UDP-N-acetylmuramoyl-L-alanyl-D-glutamate--2,6-diaminopimelate ligase, partial [candidate division WOR-3 bacterium]|nr:UDP-N-acetylmuramoyl-L-alanyl-D-glutamate--2,6-diaminopimelate ligase [candidate division WOR-3 bacterium]